jgi:hypothetical protein
MKTEIFYILEVTENLVRIRIRSKMSRIRNTGLFHRRIKATSPPPPLTIVVNDPLEMIGGQELY